MITVTGRTFENRELLMQYGGRWNSETRRWEFDHVSPTRLTILRSTIGLIVNETAEPEPISIYSMNIDATPRHVRFSGSQQSAIYGDDPTYHNHFADQNAKAFFGFSSLDAFADYIADLLPDRQRMGWDEGALGLYGTSGMVEALKLARQGWHDGVEQAAGIIERLSLANPRVRRRKPSVAGGSVSVGRMLAGDPRHMNHRPRQPGKKIVTVFVEAGFSQLITNETMIARAALVGAIIDLMENVGYSCGIVATDTSIYPYNQGAIYQLAVTIKEPGEQLNLSDVVFALGHPSFMMRLSYAAQTCVDETRPAWIKGDMGWPSNSFDDDHRCGSKEFYVPVIARNIIDDDPLSILRYVIPNNLPIEIKRD